MEIIKMWDIVPGYCEETPVIEYYKAQNKKADGAVVIFPGGGYVRRAEYEGKNYAEYLNSIGVDAFVVEYRVAPHKFPLQLLDARRGVRIVRYNASKYGINPDKLAVMGSSAGGHLAALISTYRGEIEFENQDEIDKMDYLPNFQILAYPVIAISDIELAHKGSLQNLVGDHFELAPILDPSVMANEKTPKAFVWHTSKDEGVNVCNSLKYGKKLRELNIPFEMHIFPDGPHGLGLAENNPHVAQWTELLKNWLKLNSFFD